MRPPEIVLEELPQGAHPKNATKLDSCVSVYEGRVPRDSSAPGLPMVLTDSTALPANNISLMDSDDSVGLATVYRVLTQFEAAGIVSRHNFDDGHSVYELASEEHHDHMVDVDNGKVIEFVNERIEDLQHQIANEHGYELVDHELVLFVRKKKD